MKQTITLIACLALSVALVGQDGALTTARAEYKAMKAEYDAAMDAYYLASRRVSSSPAYQKAREAKDADALSKLRGAVVAPNKKAWIDKFQKSANRYSPTAGEAPSAKTCSRLPNTSGFCAVRLATSYMARSSTCCLRASMR